MKFVRCESLENCFLIEVACVMQNQTMMEMKTRLEELHMEHEYQLRLKAMSHNEKIRELSDKLTQQMEFLETMQQVCCSPTREVTDRGLTLINKSAL